MTEGNLMSDIEQIEAEVLTAINGAGDLAALDGIRVAELGKKGRVSGLMKTLAAWTRKSVKRWARSSMR